MSVQREKFEWLRLLTLSLSQNHVDIKLGLLLHLYCFLVHTESLVSHLTGMAMDTTLLPHVVSGKQRHRSLGTVS